MSTREWVERSRSIAPVVCEYRDQSEQQRYMAEPIFDAIRRTGIIGMLTPAVLGGPQADVCAALQVIEEISRQDGSAGWNAMIWSTTGLFADYLSEDAAAEIIGSGAETVIGGAIRPTGYARPVAGGFQIRGRWAFASGYHYLRWVVATCIVVDDGEPRMLPDGQPEILLAFVPVSDTSMIDTWFTAGLRGTGSHDFGIDGAFVPSERTVPLGALFTGPNLRANTAYRTPFYDLACGHVATVGLGIARDAIDTLKAIAAEKIPDGGTITLASLHTMHERIGRAEALLRSARVYLFGTEAEISAKHQAGQPPTDEDAAALRLAAALAAQNAVDVVDLMFDCGGGSAIYQSSRLERCFRDVHMITHHICASAMNVEMAGQYFLSGRLQVRR